MDAGTKGHEDDEGKRVEDTRDDDGGEAIEERTSSESDDSETAEENDSTPFTRRMSTVLSTGKKAILKEGYLMKQSGSFQRGKRRHFTLLRGVVFFSKEKKATVREKIDLKNASVAECGAKGSHTFTVISPHRTLVLMADSRKEMEEWVSAFQSAASSTNRSENDIDVSETQEAGAHHWFACSHARPTYCNVCHDALGGVTSRGLSCEVCKFKAHKRCAVYAPNNCKWVTVKMIPSERLFPDDQLAMKHQWIRGNLPAGAKCAACDRACGSARRLQDWRCLWCKTLVHDVCRACFDEKCDLGANRVSILPPSAIRAWDASTRGRAEAVRPSISSPLLVFVNSKSGDNHGVKFLRKFKQLLNPAQVFDLITSGPSLGLRLFQSFESFRILVCGGDGSVGWVLTEVDKLGLINKCQVGVLPLGTGNDLARVLGWGATCDDETQLPNILQEMESSGMKMVDRWSIQTKPDSHVMSSNLKVTKLPALPPVHVLESHGLFRRNLALDFAAMTELQNSVASCLAVILGEESVDKEVINSARILCHQVKAFVSSVIDEEQEESDSNSIRKKCSVLNDKLSSLLLSLNEEVDSQSPSPPTTVQLLQQESEQTRILYDVNAKALRSREAVMLRANSLKKAVKEIIDHAEQAIDSQVNEQTAECEAFMQSVLDTATVTENRHIVDADLTTEACATVAVGTDEGISEGTAENEATGRPSRPIQRARMTSSDSGFGSSGRKMGGGDQTRPVNGGKKTTFMPNLSAALLRGASALVAPVTSSATFPDVPPPPPPGSGQEYQEINVMNNYFGIGLDAKISLAFHHKREEHPEQCKNRLFNKMWYGVLSGKEFLSQTYKNLHQRIVLECDGKLVPLPVLQGLVILNIPSYMGGTNFWGTEREKDGFYAPSFDDKMLEVVAVTGVSQMAKSRMLGIQSHRLSQCRSLKITICGDFPIPCQVDGEAWLQETGQIKITHKNRVQMLARNKAFYSTLQSWRTQGGNSTTSSSSRLGSNETLNLPLPLAIDNVREYWPLVEKTMALISRVKSTADSNETVKSDLVPLARAASASIERLFPLGLPSEHANSGQTEDLVIQVKRLMQESGWLIAMKRLASSDETEFTTALRCVEGEMRKIQQKESRCGSWPPSSTKPLDEEAGSDAESGPENPSRGRSNTDPAANVVGLRRESGKSLEVDPKRKKKYRLSGLRYIGKLFMGKGHKYVFEKEQQSAALNWDATQVQLFLDRHGFSEYRETFLSEDIRGPELLSLTKADLKELGVRKVGHVKRLFQLIKGLRGNSAVV